LSNARPNSEAHSNFYHLALQYYVAGRAAFLCGVNQTTGNLLHHAVEMLLKGHLSKTIPLDDLRDRKKFCHSLSKLWSEFKHHFPAEDLTGFDAIIHALEKFEEIRYPNPIRKRGAAIAVGLCKGNPTINSRVATELPEYWTGICDVDALFARLFPLCRLNPHAYFSFLSSLGYQVVNENNAECENWFDPQVKRHYVGG